ncbi:Tetratricopeptide repeat/TPR repeat [Chthonomonas calidirosea]|uniref:Tetratricopeptide repeat./TPR repeat n=1 Tax=Chthonomonas calidirosea (strain DSM 23976 / ICMP 18418 / T49) TaxID=1303518 RepID=S0EY44_CHTCT|nr:tetratricopeptide repeat protein [Chthonomonas calidirosea]CCW34740.1 Tetratricopeptide repeat./TPR repeat [Chthonomonas calidirosea T49]CEK13930.1 Tetratricopeptide repeat/TPR repeat [Chthonomonas calidirosea]
MRTTSIDEMTTTDNLASTKEERSPYLGIPKKLQITLLAGVLAVLAAGLTWWFGPWSHKFHIRHMGFLELHWYTESHPKDGYAWRELGLRLARDGDAQLAEPALIQATLLNPNDPEPPTALAEIYIAQKHYKEAFELLKSVTSRFPNYELAHVDLGRIYIHKASYLHAADEYQAAVKLDPKDSVAWRELGICYLQMQQSANAEQAVQRALQLDPKNPDYLALASSVDAAVGKIDQAVAEARQAALLAPRNLPIQSNLVTILLQNPRSPSDIALAARTLDYIRQHAPTAPLLPYQEGLLAEQQGHWQEAVHDFEQAIQLNPSDDAGYYALGQALRHLGRTAEATKALAIYQRHQDLRRRIENIRLELGSNSNNPKLYLQLARLQLQIPDLAGAIESLQNAHELAPNDPTITAHLQQLQQIQNAQVPAGQ